MLSVFVREQKHYTLEDLSEVFKLDKAKTTECIEKLSLLGVLKICDSASAINQDNDLYDIEADTSYAGTNTRYYVFVFVGVIVVSGIVIKCYPKYLLKDGDHTYHIKQILKVLDKLKRSKLSLDRADDFKSYGTSDLLSIMLFILNDYFENGLYSNIKEIIEINGNGDIHWDRTVNDCFSIIQNNRPYYLDLKTRHRLNDDLDYFKLLHECVVSSISRDLKTCGLLDLFDLEDVSLTDSKIDDFGDKDYILYKLACEQNSQFNTRKQLLLKALYSYIDKSQDTLDSTFCTFYGTTSFHVIWERVCAFIFNDMLHERIENIFLPQKIGSSDYSGRLIDLIEKPTWTVTDTQSSMTLIPDIVTIDTNADRSKFIIIDAKYYTPSFRQDRAPCGVPGIESITKQYLYQLAFKNFIDNYKFSSVENYFVFPTDDDSIKDAGKVFMQMLDDLGLESIKVRFMPAIEAFNLYLSDKKLAVDKLNL